MKNVTMRDIGAALGVSTVTISKALGGKEGVSDAVREKIIETAKQMGYHYSAPLGDDSGRVVGILVADRFFSAPSFYFSLYRALLKELAEAGMLGVLDIISDQDEASLTMPAAVTIQRASGFVLLGQFSADYVSAILDTGLPTVLLDFTCDGPDVDSVTSDGQSGAYQLTRYLIEHGHRKIGFVGSVEGTTSIMDRYSGFLRAMMQFALPVREDWVVPDRDTDLRGRDRLEGVRLPGARGGLPGGLRRLRLRQARPAHHHLRRGSAAHGPGHRAAAAHPRAGGHGGPAAHLRRRLVRGAGFREGFEHRAEIGGEIKRSAFPSGEGGPRSGSDEVPGPNKSRLCCDRKQTTPVQTEARFICEDLIRLTDGGKPPVRHLPQRGRLFGLAIFVPIHMLNFQDFSNLTA